MDYHPHRGVQKQCVDMLRGGIGTRVRLVLVDTANNKTNTVELSRERIL